MRWDYTEDFEICLFLCRIFRGGIAGYVAFYANDTEGKTAYISNIGVVSGCQRRRIGSVLMEKCLEVAADKSMSKVRLEVLSTNEKAISFYKYWGFDFESEGEAGTRYMSRRL